VTGPKFQAFIQGEWSTGDYASQSEADLGFANLIVFWTDDPDQVLRIVKVSGMWRDKWERADYASGTIGKAFAGRKNRYDPNYNKPRFENNVGQADDEPPPGPSAGVTDEMLEMAPASDGPPRDETQPAPPKESIPLTDLGNGKRFAADHGEIVRFCHPWGKWLIWDGKRWRIDDTGRVMALAKQTILGLFRWAEEQIKLLADDESPDARIKIARIKAVLDFALKSQHYNRLKAMVDLAKSEPGIPILPEILDADPWALNCLNGTLDLRTGELHPHNQAAYLTNLCPVSFNPAATCPSFINTVNGIFNYDKALIKYVQRFLGYGLTGDTREHVVPIAYGGGSNGKTLLFTIILETIGTDYSGVVPPELLMETHGDQHPTIKADLFGKRLMVAAETKQGGRLNEERLKALSGSDPVKARRMREDFWEFDPTHKLVVMTNHRPEIRGDDDGIWRRLALWPFTVRYWDADKGETGPPEFQADKTLPEKLQAEREGILAWLVAGCLDWQRHGMVMPAAVRAATAEYRSAEDQLGAFLAERCTLNSEFRVKASTLYETFKEWCKANGNRDMNATAFGMALAVRRIRRDDGRRWYLGVALAADEGQ
jgi:putative DNA primase/helicase